MNAPLQEQILRDFFDGRSTAGELSADLEGSLVRTTEKITRHPVVDMQEDYEVTAADLLKLCDAVIAGSLEPWKLQAIGFCVIASSRFHWDGDTKLGNIVSETLHDWSAPEINYSLNVHTARMFREKLRSGISASGVD